jgi:YD repeat-containing protein
VRFLYEKSIVVLAYLYRGLLYVLFRRLWHGGEIRAVLALRDGEQSDQSIGTSEMRKLIVQDPISSVILLIVLPLIVSGVWQSTAFGQSQQISIEGEDKDLVCKRDHGADHEFFAWPGWCGPSLPCPEFPQTTSVPCCNLPHTGCGTGVMRILCPQGFTMSSGDLVDRFCTAPSIVPASNTGRPCPSCQNPMSPAVGNKFQEDLDYVASGSFPLKLVRRYNSLSVEPTDADNRPKYKGIFGDNWRSEYERSVTVPSEQLTVVTAYVRRPDGRTFYFNRQGSVYVPQGFVSDRLEKLLDGSGAFVGWRLITADGDETETYDAAGRLISIVNRAGLAQTVAYDASGRLESVADPFGRRLTFIYNPQNRVATMTDPSGATYSFTYGSSNNLTSVVYPDNRTRTYLYENEDVRLLTGITDENAQRVSTWSYTVFGGVPRVFEGEKAGGVDRFRFTTFGSNFSTTTVEDPLGAVRTYSFQPILGVQRNTGITGAAGAPYGPAAQTFDANGNVATRTDWNGNRTTYTYDLTRNLETRRIEAAGSSLARTISTEWHATFRLPTRIAEPKRITSFVYNGDSGLTCGAPGALCRKTIQGTSDANGSQGFSGVPVGTPRVWSYTTNANGQVLSVDGPRTDVPDLTTYTYYANDGSDLGKRGAIASIANALGHTTQISSYDPHGNPLTIVDPNGLVTTLTYDPRQRLTSRTVGAETTSYTYDGVGQLTRVTLPDASFLAYTYDAAHRLTAMTDTLGNRIAYTLDAMGNRTKEEVFGSGNTLAQTRSRAYSSVNRLSQDIGGTTPATQITTYGYDNQGNLKSIAAPLNRNTLNDYDALHRLMRVTDPAAGQTTYAYDGLDQLQGVTDPRGLVTSYATDGLGNLTQLASPDTGTTVNSYDAAGNLSSTRDAKGQQTLYQYDALNRLTRATFADGAVQLYSYDQGPNAIGRLSAITETDAANQPTSQLATSYTAQGRLASEARSVNGQTYTTLYAYDAAGRLAGMTYPSGRTVTYAFDPLGRVSQVNTVSASGSQLLATNIAYQPFGAVKSFILGNGQSVSRSYDLDGRMKSYTLGPKQYSLTFDEASRLKTLTETAVPANTTTYGYDALDRLNAAILPASTYGYSYDATGNRLTRSVGTNTDTYTTPPTTNRLQSLSPAGGATRPFSFDANGSTVNDALNNFAYDARGRLVQATSSVGTSTYQINALGQRFRKSNAQSDTVYHYDAQGRLIAESSASGQLQREYLYLNDMPLAVVQ